ncbi:MAG: TIGR04211 family SH3 domain-containing protein [Pseudomonadota bacterium]
MNTGLRTLTAVAMLACAMQAGAQTQTAYVTDVLRLGLHRAADTSDAPFRSLESGQEMTVLERSRLYARIRLPDGTEGYVKAGFLVDDKPARLVVTETREALAASEATLASVRDEFSGSANRIAGLESDLQGARDAVANLQTQYDDAAAANADYERKMRVYGLALPWPLALGAVLVSLVLGFVGGFWWIDSRSRKRHGGFRIY